MATAFYRNGTVAVTQGSKVVTGTGTNWTTGAVKPLAGDVFIFNNKIYEVEHIISDTEIRLFRNFEDATANGQAYVIIRNASLNISSRIAAQVAQVVNQKQILLTEFNNWMVSTSDQVIIHDSVGDPVSLTPLAKLLKDVGDASNQLDVIRQYVAEAVAARDKAKQWADAPEGTAVETGKFSAKHWAAKSKEHADAAKLIQTDVTAKGAQATKDAATATAKAGIATTKAGEATASASAAQTEANLAKQERIAAGVSADKAEVATNLLYMMTESEARAIQMLNLDHFDASGMVNTGKSHTQNANYQTINEGLWTRLDKQNTLLMGTGLSPVVTSKTDFAVTHIAGVVSNVLNIDEANTAQSKFLLPEAEDGTRIYDSTGDARGSGKASLDLKVDQDPKYGDIPTGTDAQILREAVGRAFEGGHIKNGDLRNGSNDWTDTSVGSGSAVVSNGTVLISGTSPTDRGGFRTNAINLTIGDEYIITYYATVTSGSYNVTGLPQGNLVGLTDSGLITVSFIADGSADVLTWEAEGGGGVFSFGSVSIRKATEEVVTRPVDLLGFEYYEEELIGRQEVFECIQSLSTTFGDTDVPTVLSTRPISYFQQYDGQFADPTLQNDRYRCVVWSDLSEEDKRKVAAYMGEKLFVGVNGNLVNGRLRARTFRGGKNGDWDFYKSALSSTANYLYTTPEYRPQVQGISDTVDRYVGNVGALTYGNGQVSGLPATVYNENSLFTARSAGSRAYQGRCYFYVVATVPRANKAMYDENLNPWGTSKGVRDSAGDQGSQFWYEANTKMPKTQANCFEAATFGGSTGYYRPDSSGFIGSAAGSGHPDGILYDGIEAGGLNGVIDWRLGAVANDSPEEAAKVEAKVENGTYRGLEKLVKTVPFDNSGALYLEAANSTHSMFRNQPSGTGEAVSFYAEGFAAYSPVVIWQPETGVVLYGSVSHIDSHLALSPDSKNYGMPVTSFPNNSTSFNRTAPCVMLCARETNLSVSGEFNTQMVIGDPVNILQTEALKGGWLGTWCPVIPDGTTNQGFPATRKALGTKTITRLIDRNDGNGWVPITAYNLNSKNWVAATLPLGNMLIVPYKAFAKQTKPSTNKPVYNAKAGLMSVSQVCYHATDRGVLFAESLIGKVVTNSATANANSGGYSLTEKRLNVDSKFDAADWSYPRHAPLNLVAPNNNSKAVKVIPCQISNNGQGSIGYQANELTWGSPTYIDKLESEAGYTAGLHYKITDGAWRGRYVCVNTTSIAVNHTSFSRNQENMIVNDNGKTYLVWLGGVDSSWGDDGKIKIAADGSDTFVDLNGNTNLSVVHELAIPYGWTSNHARAGKQVPGVDL